MNVKVILEARAAKVWRWDAPVGNIDTFILRIGCVNAVNVSSQASFSRPVFGTYS